MERWERINAAPPDQARAELTICCGSPRWVERMVARRPFASLAEARSAAREEWFALDPDEWREAFKHHPKIGAASASPVASPGASPVASPVAQDFSPASAVSAREQSGVASAAADVKQALADGNRAYQQRFGYIYIVCATGKTAEEMLAILRSRLGNDPIKEIQIAAEEHAKICDLRLA